MGIYRNGRRSTDVRGLPLRRVNAVMIVITLLLSVVLIISTYATRMSFSSMRTATEEYIETQKDAADMQAGSDYLTAQVRAFVITADPQRAQNFFEEIHVTKRRENALNSLGAEISGTEAYRYLENAMSLSNELVTIEYYAIRLVVEAKGYDLSAYPDELRLVDLKAEDLALTEEEQLDKAADLIFNDLYQDYKDGISDNVALCLESLIEETRTRQMESTERLHKLLIQENVLIVALLVLVFATFLMNILLVIRPLEKNVDWIEQQKMLPMKGSREIQFFAKTYNHMYGEIQRNQAQLSYDATHDALTGLFNRGVFERVREQHSEENIALILIDVDKFKTINDTYGHDAGDKILRKAAGLISGSFRSEDYVCRIGGDEFAVVMENANSQMRDLIYHKIMAAIETLQHPDDGLPAASLSVGAAFGDRKNPNADIYRDADTALYKVKNSGGADCAFYE